VKSALRIRSTADTKDEIEDMRKRSGNSFWQESDHRGGDHNYDAQVHNLSIARFLIVAPTVLNRGVAIRNGQLHYAVVTMASGQRGFAPSAHVWIQERFGPAQPSHMHASERDRPRSAAVAFTSAVPDAVRQKAFGSYGLLYQNTRLPKR
jgi:predicted dehydrogenase